MTRTFWERWKWELEKRKEVLLTNNRTGHLHLSYEAKPNLHEIHSSLLTDHIYEDKRQECYLGHGSFGIVRLMMHQGIHVAVKQLHVGSVLEDVQREVEITACLCHPFLPCLFWCVH